MRTKSDTAKKHKIGSGRKPLTSQLNIRLFEFLEEERSEGRPVSNELLRMRALQIAGGLQIGATFRASPGWLARWKRQFNVGLWCGTSNSQFLQADHAEKLLSFRKAVFRSRRNIDPCDTINMDQTMCRFDMAPSRLNSKRREDHQNKKHQSWEKGVYCCFNGHSLWREASCCDRFQREGW